MHAPLAARQSSGVRWLTPGSQPARGHRQPVGTSVAFKEEVHTAVPAWLQGQPRILLQPASQRDTSLPLLQHVPASGQPVAAHLTSQQPAWEQPRLGTAAAVPPPPTATNSSEQHHAGSQTPSTHPAVVMQCIKAARSVPMLTDVWHQYQHEFNQVHLTAALLQLAQLVSSGGQAAAAQLKDSAGMQARSYSSPRYRSSSQHAGALLQAASATHMHLHQPPASIRNPATGARSAGSAAAASRAAVSPVSALLGALLQGLRPCVKSLDTCGLANMVQALGLLNYYDWQLLHDLADACLAAMSSFTRNQLTAIIRGLAQLQYKPHAGWRQAFYSAALHQVSADAAHEQGLAAGAKRRPRLRSQPPMQQQHQHQQGDSQGYSNSTNSSSNSSRSRSSEGSASSPGVDLAEVQQRNSCIVGCLWGLQLLDCRPPPAWIAGMLARMELPWASPNQLSGVMYSLARLRFAPSSAWSTQLLQVAQQQLWEQLQDSSDTGRTGPHAHKHGRDNHSSAAAANTPGRRPQLRHDGKVQGRADGTHAASASPPQNSRQQQQQQERQHVWQLQHIVQLVWGVAQLGVQVPSCWVLPVYCALLGDVRRAQTRECVMLLQAMSQLHQRSNAQPQGQQRQQHHVRVAAATPQQLQLLQRVLQQATGPGSHSKRTAGGWLRRQRVGAQRQQLQRQQGNTLHQQQDSTLQQQQSSREEGEQDGLLAQATRLLVRRVLKRAAENVHETSPSEAVLMMLYCSRLRVGPLPFWMRAMLDTVILPHLALASPMDLAHTAYSVGRLRFRCRAKLPHALLRTSQPILHLFTPQELANFCWGLAWLRAAPTNRWLAKAGAAIFEGASRLRPQEINQLAWALPRLARSPKRLRVLAAHQKGLHAALMALTARCKSQLLLARLHAVLAPEHGSSGEMQAHALQSRRRAWRVAGFQRVRQQCRWQRGLPGVRLRSRQARRCSAAAAALGLSPLLQGLQVTYGGSMPPASALVRTAAAASEV